ncbi:MAG: hypothetical protein IKO47_07275 [Ruminococcus sp.]|nr:hypothetical protein [Ruminococcus sp.]
MKKYSKIIAGALAIALSAGATTSIAFAKNGSDNDDTVTAGAPAAGTADESGTADTERTALESPAFKDETVYVVCDSDSSIKHIIVSDWIKNAPALSSIKDSTILTDIQNVKGDETYELSEGGITWKANGNDIYYRGNSSKELPVTVKMKYYLDGVESSPADIIGKSGHLVIRWEFTNNVKVTKDINGRKKDVYVPFLCASAAVFNSEKFVNAQISSGKVLSDGNRLIVVGVALPGLTESLGLDQVENIDLQLPEYVEFSADVTDFETGLSVAAVSNEIFSRLDGKADFSFGNVKEQIDELINGATSLMEGTAALSGGLDSLAEKSGDLTSGAKKLADGALSLKEGSAKLSGGAAALSEGAKTLSDSTGAFKTGLQSAKDGSKKIAAGSEKLASGSASLQTGAENLSKGSQELVAGMDTAGSSLNTTIAANEQVLAAMEALYTQSPSPELAKAIETMKQTIAGQKQVAAALSSGGTLNSGAAALQQGASQLSAGAVEINKGLGDIKTGASALDSGLGDLLTGSTKLSEGALKIYQSSVDLSKGAATVSEGAATLSDGATALYSGVKTYTEAVAKLRSGASDIKNGMAKFNDEGVSRISAAIDEKLPTIIENFKAVHEASKEYKSYSGISDDMDGAVKFVYMFDGTSFSK